MIFQKGMPNQSNLVIGFWDMGPAEFEQACCRCGIQPFRNKKFGGLRGPRHSHTLVDDGWPSYEEEPTYAFH